jgi:L-fucose isomerase-like protein
MAGSSTREVVLVASGDLRETANVLGWPAQEELEAAIGAAFARHGVQVRRGHPVDAARGHGFISSQRMGMDVFAGIDRDAPLVVAEAVWEYSHHVLPGLRRHRGPILTMANWRGEWPGLVGMLNINASLTKMGKPYSSIWSDDMQDDFADRAISTWIETGSIVHDTSHVHDLDRDRLPVDVASTGRRLASELADRMAIVGVFDEGCMGMYNAIIDDEYLNPAGLFKERLSQSALFAEMRLVTTQEARAGYDWLRTKGMTFDLGSDGATQLTEDQVLDQVRLYTAALRIADRFGCDTIGIQYQQGLKDVAPASDLAEGLLNDAVRPPVKHIETGQELYAGRPLPCFNEVDEGSAVDGLVTNRVWTALGLDPATTLHDVRWGEQFGDDYVWVFEISGAVPPAHLEGGYAGAVSQRQPPVYFGQGGGTIKGISKPGEIVWSRVFIMDGALHADLGRGTVVELPRAETERRWQATTPQWPIMHAVLHDVSRDQMMARHKANHIQVAYANDAASADRALLTKAAMFDAMGLQVHLCGVTQDAAPA